MPLNWVLCAMENRMHILIIVTLLLVGAILYLSKKKEPPPIPTIGSEFERDVTEKEFEQMVIETSKNTLVMVDFYANWCPPCRELTPLLAEVAADYDGNFLLAKINTDKNPNLKNEYGVTSIPTVAFFKDGKPVDVFDGARNRRNLEFALAKHGVSSPETGT